MRNMKTWAAALLAGLFLSASSFGAAYLKFDGVDGESKDKDHKGWIDILSVSGLSPRDAASGKATGKRQHKPVTIVKRIDKASPMLAKAASGRTSGLPSTLRLEMDGRVYVLEGVKVLSSKKEGSKETISFSYTKIEHDTAKSMIQNTRAVKAQDYNSSRSNNEARAASAPANHNSTRSNRTSE
ncbi:MAG: type VI secretion system tube protein Hcp [Verrucomicrobiota bacterium]